MTHRIPGVEERLQKRYRKLIQEYSGHAHAEAAGPRVLPEETPEAAAMGAWRFYKNPRTTPTRLVQPLLEAAEEAAARHCDGFALVAMDWSKLNYYHHTSKKDRLQIGLPTEVGYKLLSGLLVSDRDGRPLAPLFCDLLTAAGILSSRCDRPLGAGTALDDVAGVMGYVTSLPLGKRPLFVIDAEADSVFHLRDWYQRGFLFLVRGDDDRALRLVGADGEQREEVPMRGLPERLRRQKAFRCVREVAYKGRKVGQYVAESAVVLERPAWLHRMVDGKRKRLVRPGKALPLRLVITELRDKRGRVLERWYLLTNAPKEVDAATIALWYYWRWKIETLFKLLKGHGQHLEHWQQDNGWAILKRLLVASMACVLAWRLAYSEAPQAEEARQVVMSLSGRQLEHGKKFTAEGLLAGTWVLLAIVAMLRQQPLSRLGEIADFVLNGSVDPTVQPASRPLREAG